MTKVASQWCKSGWPLDPAGEVAKEGHRGVHISLMGPISNTNGARFDPERGLVKPNVVNNAVHERRHLAGQRRSLVS
jgi:hypothetical protein